MKVIYGLVEKKKRTEDQKKASVSVSVCMRVCVHVSAGACVAMRAMLGNEGFG